MKVAAEGVSVSDPHLPVDDPALRTAEPGDPDHYEIRYCLDRHYLQMRLIGMWDEAILARFAERYRAVMHALADNGGISHALVDASGFDVQAPEIADTFPHLISSVPRRPDQRTASVVGTVVTRVQARSGGDLINARYFRSKHDAVDWLFSDEA